MLNLINILVIVVVLLAGSNSEKKIPKIYYVSKTFSAVDYIQTLMKDAEKYCPGFNKKFIDAAAFFEECIDNVERSVTICTAIQGSAINCTVPIVQVFSDCLPEPEKKIPQLVVRSTVSVIEFLCHQSGESILELVNPCYFGKSRLKQCEQNILKFSGKSQRTFAASELCTIGQSLRHCYETGVSECKNQKTKDVVLGLYDSIVAPCSNLTEL